MKAAEGFEEVFDTDFRRIYLEQNNPVSPEEFSLAFVVGPQALKRFVDRGWEKPCVYSMVLRPGQIIPDSAENFCGVSLDLFSGTQINYFSKIFPGIKKYGVLYNPANKGSWYLPGKMFASIKGVELVPLVVKAPSETVEVFTRNASKIEAVVFIPDPVVISPSIIKHVIKTGISLGIPSIGYNRFFHKSGAAASFVVDYKEAGKKAGKQANSVLKGKKCRKSGPPYRILLNEKVIELLDIETRPDAPGKVYDR